MADGVEVWLQSLSESAAKTIKELNVNIIQDCNAGVVMDEWPSKVTINVVIDTLLYHNWLYIVHIPVVFSIILFQVNVFNHSYKLCIILNLCW